MSVEVHFVDNAGDGFFLTVSPVPKSSGSESVVSITHSEAEGLEIWLTPTDVDRLVEELRKIVPPATKVTFPQPRGFNNQSILPCHNND